MPATWLWIRENGSAVSLRVYTTEVSMPSRVPSWSAVNRRSASKRPATSVAAFVGRSEGAVGDGVADRYPGAAHVIKVERTRSGMF